MLKPPQPKGMALDTKTLRRIRILALSIRLWRKRLLFWCGAISIGIIASYFALAADWAKDIFNTYIEPHKFLPVIITPVAFAISAGLCSKYFPAAVGSGIPQVIAARIMREQETRKKLLGLKVAIAKILLTLLGIMAGASIGREGPSVQIGASIMLLCAGISNLTAQRGIVLAGAAAGVAAAFNTPLAGIVFAIEEMARAFEQRNSSVVLIAIVLAGAAAMSILGNYDYFGYTNTSISLTSDWAAVIVLGLLGGLLGSLFAKILTEGGQFSQKLFKRMGNKGPVIFAVLCGIVVALLGIATKGATFGAGYALGHDLLHGEMQPYWWQMPAKFLATAICAISGIAGGIFSPSLSVGAAMGAELAQWFNTNMEGMVLLGMVAYFAGVTQAPITAFVIVLEITGKGTDPVPLIAAAVIAAGVGRLICPTSLYHALAKGFIRTKTPENALNHGQAQSL